MFGERMMVEEHYAVMETLDNLTTLKCLYDRGYDISGIDHVSGYFHNSHSGLSGSLDFITEVLNRLFDNADYFDEGDISNVLHALKMDECMANLEGPFVIVISDDILDSFVEDDFSHLSSSSSHCVTSISRGPEPTTLLIGVEYLESDFSEFIPHVLDVIERRRNYANKHTA